MEVININLEQVCRLCMLPASNLKDIFSNSIVDGHIISVSNMLAYTVDIFVNAYDYRLLPNKICADCQKQLASFYMFKQKTKRSEHTLLSVLGKNDQASMIISNDPQKIIDIEVSEENSVNVSKIQYQKKKIDQPTNHMENHKVKQLAEPIVTQSTFKSNDICNVKLVRSAKQNPQLERKSTSSNTHLYENSFQQSFEMGRKLLDFIAKYIHFPTCNSCCLLFVSEEKLNEHNSCSHSKITTIQFDESYTDYQILNEDIQSQTKSAEYYSCGECKIYKKNIGEIKYHVMSHAEKFDCPIENCGCQYSDFKHFCIHLFKKHINTKYLQCIHCNNSFQSYEDLQRHIKNYCTERRYECHECDKKFYSKNSLEHHLKLIKNHKEYKCTICEKCFKQRGQLSIHMRSHTNERPYKCTICQKSYKTSSMRAAHMDSHINGNTFECGICQKLLKTRVTYRLHLNRHSQQKRHGCEICGKRFFTKYNLKSHQSKIHKKIVTNDDDFNILNDDDFAKLINDDDIMNCLITIN